MRALGLGVFLLPLDDPAKPLLQPVSQLNGMQAVAIGRQRGFRFGCQRVLVKFELNKAKIKADGLDAEALAKPGNVRGLFLTPNTIRPPLQLAYAAIVLAYLENALKLKDSLNSTLEDSCDAKRSGNFRSTLKTKFTLQHLRLRCWI